MGAARLRPLRRVVITGIGVVAPNGIGKEPFWHACIAGRSGVRRITRFDASPLPSQIAGEVLHFDPLQFGLTAQEIQHTDRATQFALASAQLALLDAHLLACLGEDEREQVGVIIGSALACLEEGERQWSSLTSRGAGDPYLAPGVTLPSALLMSHAPASSIAAHHQLYGPCSMIATGCSAGADAIGQAFWTIQEQRADRMLAGGTDASISYGGAQHWL